MNSFIVSGYGTTPNPTIKQFKLDSEKQLITETCSVVLQNPSFICLHENVLFSLTEVDGQGIVWMYQLEDDTLTPLDSIAIEGGGICHLSYSAKHHTLFGACYQTGHIFSIDVSDNHFNGVKSLIHLAPCPLDGITRAHCVQMDIASDYLYAVNIHTDQIYCYQVDSGSLVPNQAFPSLTLPKGNGPRHILFHPSLPIGYIITEYSNKIFVVTQDRKTGALDIIQEISTLPADYTGQSYCSNCVITPNKQYLLAANRGHNSISTLKILATGTLTLVSHTVCEGVWPRHIDCFQDGKTLMICNQKSDEVVFLTLDEAQGLLGKASHHLAFTTPSFAQEIL